jgi:hypothetical protein
MIGFIAVQAVDNLKFAELVGNTYPNAAATAGRRLDHGGT